MNKQEAIEKIKDLYSFVMEDGPFEVDLINKNQVIDLVSQIDKPQKVTIPEFVAEWIEWCKRSGWHLQKILSRLDDDEKVGDWTYDENDDLIPEKVDMIARAWLDGYEVEKEKLYTVEIPNPNIIGNEHTVLMTNIFNQIVMVRVYGDNWRTAKGYHLTEAKIKQDFEWAWQWAKEVEEEE